MSNPIESWIKKHNPQSAQQYENMLKEALQEITLAGLARANFFDKAAFYGGTALRIFYGLPRYSEDLDFTLLKVDHQFKLAPYFKSVSDMLASFGFNVEIGEVKKKADRQIESAFLKASTHIHFLKIEAAANYAKKIQKNQILKIKFEVDCIPPLGFECEVKNLPPPITSSVRTLKTSSLFAGKMHAVLFRKWENRIKGRDFYDLLWYLGQGIPVKLSYLEEKMKEGGRLSTEDRLTPKKLHTLLEARIKAIDWVSAKKDALQFISDPAEVAPWSSEFFLSAARNIKTE